MCHSEEVTYSQMAHSDAKSGPTLHWGVAQFNTGLVGVTCRGQFATLRGKIYGLAMHLIELLTILN